LQTRRQLKSIHKTESDVLRGAGHIRAHSIAPFSRENFAKNGQKVESGGRGTDIQLLKLLLRIIPVKGLTSVEKSRLKVRIQPKR
jgi:hypothetical protein